MAAAHRHWRVSSFLALLPATLSFSSFLEQDRLVPLAFQVMVPPPRVARIRCMCLETTTTYYHPAAAAVKVVLINKFKKIEFFKFCYTLKSDIYC